MAAYCFFFYGALGVLLPYQPLYYQSIGLAGEEIGLLVGLGPLMVLISGPLWGAIGDRFNLHRWLLPIATFGALLPIGLIPLTHDLTALIAVVLLQAFFGTAIGPLMDSAAVDIAETTGTSYGQIRLGGTFGFLIISPAVGWLLTRIPLVSIFYIYIGLMALSAISALALPPRQKHWQAPMWQGFRALLTQRTFSLLLIAGFLVGVAINAVQFFFPLYITSIGGDSNLLGIANAIGAISEIPILFGSRRILKRLGPLWVSVMLGTLIYAVRWLLLSFATTAPTIFLVQILHGLSFGLFIAAGVAYVESLAPGGLSATAQSLFIVATWGLGGFAGSVGGGIIFDAFGPARLFQLCSVVTFIALGVLMASRPPSSRG
jgi:MFS family permease